MNLRTRPSTKLAAVLGLLVALVVVPRGALAEGPRVSVAELSPQAESAIDKGLAFLAKSQRGDGAYGGQHSAAVTGLGLMAFMVKGHMPGEGRYGQSMDRALSHLIARSNAGGGYIGSNMYEHALATLALSEAWGMSERPDIRDALKKAVEVILRAQHSSGGWRYQPVPLEHDVSVTVMQVVALASAQEAGIMVPAETIDKAMTYIKKCQKSDGGFSYQYSGGSSAFARSAASVLGLMLGGERDWPGVERGLAYITRHGDGEIKGGRHYYYGQYYAVQAMYQAGDDFYLNWYPRIHDRLVSVQRGDGSWRGEISEQYATAMSILILGVPYRFLPIYQR